MTEHQHDALEAPFVPDSTPDGISRERYVALLHGVDPDTVKLPRKPTKTATHPALILALGGAPASPHTLEGLPGYYRPDSATPVGGPGEPTLEQAKRSDEQAGSPVALVYLTDRQLDAAREQCARDLSLARNGVLAAREHAAGGEVEFIADEITAQKGS